MRSKLTIGQFHNQYQEPLKLTYLSQQTGLNTEINLSTSANESYEAVDYLNIIRPSSVAVIGQKEAQYINSLSEKRQRLLLSKLYKGSVSCLVVCENAEIPQHLIEYSQELNKPILSSTLGDALFLENCRYFLSRALAEHTLEHGVFIEVNSVGTFIRGNSGMGKSELALALIAKGHRLISDDITEFTRIAPNVIDGHSPSLLADFMEVRGLGIVNVRAMFGSNAIKRNKTLRLVIHLSNFTDENKHQFDRLGIEEQSFSVLDVNIPQVTLPVASGRNLAALVEAATCNHLLNMNGYNAAEDFMERQRKAIIQNEQ